MITEREEKGIAAFYKEEGLREGFDLGKAEGFDLGKADGLAESKAEGKAEVAKAMLKNGLTVEMVMSCTGLSKKEVEELTV